jgi:hypothetical protein
VLWLLLGLTLTAIAIFWIALQIRRSPDAEDVARAFAETMRNPRHLHAEAEALRDAAAKATNAEIAADLLARAGELEDLASPIEADGDIR